MILRLKCETLFKKWNEICITCSEDNELLIVDNYDLILQNIEEDLRIIEDDILTNDEKEIIEVEIKELQNNLINYNKTVI